MDRPQLIILILATIVATIGHSNAQETWFKCQRVVKVCPNDNITFWLYPRDKPAILLNMSDPNSIAKHMPIPHRPVVIILHGMDSYRDHLPSSIIRPAILEHGGYYVISADYGRLVSSVECMSNYTDNVPYVGFCMARYIDILIKDVGISPYDIHIVGHSLGCIMSGIIAKYVRTGQLHWITALDPPNANNILLNLNLTMQKSDAKFMDVIHSDPGYIGILEPIGTVDFYVNNYTQPACKNDTIGEHGCSHLIVINWYAESVNTKAGFWGRKCYNLEEGICDQKLTTEMGFFVPHDVEGVYYVRTNLNAPYAQGKDNHRGEDNPPVKIIVWKIINEYVKIKIDKDLDWKRLQEYIAYLNKRFNRH